MNEYQEHKIWLIFFSILFYYALFYLCGVSQFHSFFFILLYVFTFIIVVPPLLKYYPIGDDWEMEIAKTNQIILINLIFLKLGCLCF